MMGLNVKELSYNHPDKENLFCDITFSLPVGGKVALVGNNGSGKSTLLKIVAGSLSPSSGEVFSDQKSYYVPQHVGQYDHLSVAEVLGVSAILNAFRAIIGGDASPEHFAVLNDDWSIEERTLAALEAWDLNHIALDQLLETMSGGEKTKVFLAGILIHEPELILLDEPSNHLDAGSRQRLYHWIRNTKQTLLVVSHDRTLLNLLDQTFELGAREITCYGGNYDFYKIQKNEQIQALQNRIDETEKALKKAQKIAREVAERKQRQDVRGKEKKSREGIPRIMMNTLRNGAEKTASKLKNAHTEKIESLSGELRGSRQELPDKRTLKMTVYDTGMHTGKILVKAEDIQFGYSGNNLWEGPLSFTILSGDRIAITGDNGSGKTTLLKMIFGQLEPFEGNIDRASFRYVYIDQDYSLLDPRLTVYEQVERFNSRMLPEHELKMLLHRYLFPKESWDKRGDCLSGGEKMRLVFCCLMVKDNAPDVFVLDEPTNNLDIMSLEIVTAVISEYRGTVLVVSHDRYFLEEIGITGEIQLKKGSAEDI